MKPTTAAVCVQRTCSQSEGCVAVGCGSANTHSPKGMSALSAASPPLVLTHARGVFGILLRQDEDQFMVNVLVLPRADSKSLLGFKKNNFLPRSTKSNTITANERV